MTNAEKITHLKAVSGESDEGLLKYYLRLAEEAILNRAFPFGVEDREIPEQYEMKQVELANILLAKRGAEGEASHSENGVSRTYVEEEKILKSIIPKGCVVG